MFPVVLYGIEVYTCSDQEVRDNNDRSANNQLASSTAPMSTLLITPGVRRPKPSPSAWPDQSQEPSLHDNENRHHHLRRYTSADLHRLRRRPTPVSDTPSSFPVEGAKSPTGLAGCPTPPSNKTTAIEATLENPQFSEFAQQLTDLHLMMNGNGTALSTGGYQPSSPQSSLSMCDNCSKLAAEISRLASAAARTDAHWHSALAKAHAASSQKVYAGSPCLPVPSRCVCIKRLLSNMPFALLQQIPAR